MRVALQCGVHARARARIAGSWQSGACYVQRAENSCACFFPLSPVFSVSPPRGRLAPPSRLLSPSLADRPENGPWLSAVSFSHLVAFIPRRDPLHNLHLCRPTKRCRAPKQRLPLRNSFLSLFFHIYRFSPFELASIRNVICTSDNFIDFFFNKMSEDHEYMGQ